MVQAILDTFEHYIDDVTVVPSRGGVFEVTAGDTLVYSKLETGRHATVEEVIEGLKAVIEIPS